MKWMLLFCLLCASYFSTAQTKEYSLCLGDSFTERPVCNHGNTVFQGLENLKGQGLHRIFQFCIDNGDTLATDAFMVFVYQRMFTSLDSSVELCENEAPREIHAYPNIPGHSSFYVAGDSNPVFQDPWTGIYFIDPARLSPGKYEVIFKVSYNNGICPSTDTMQLTIKEAPKLTTDSLPALCNNDPLFDLNQYGSPAGGKWYSKTKPAAITANKLAPSKLKIGTNWLTYKYTDGLTGCDGTDSTLITIKDCISGINEEAENPFRISPIPAKDHLNFSGATSDTKISLITTLGIEKNAKMYGNTISLENVPTGIFFVRIESDNQVYILKGLKAM